MRGRMLAAVLLGAVGLVWMAQGLGFMPGQRLHGRRVAWAVIGAVLRRRRHRPRAQRPAPPPPKPEA